MKTAYNISLVKFMSVLVLMLIMVSMSLIEIDPVIEFTILTIALTIFILTLIINTYRLKGSLGIATLSMLFFIFQFFLQVCIGNLDIYSSNSSDWEYLSKTMRIMVLSAIGYSFGMDSIFFYNLGKKFNNIVFHKFFPNPLKANYFRCCVLFFSLIPVYIWAINQGFIGYATAGNISNYESNLSITSLIGYITSIIEMIAYILFIDVLTYPQSKGKLLCGVIIILKLALAMISGMKASIILTMASLFIIYYIFKGNISRKLLVIGILLTFLIFSFNDVYRNILRNQSFELGRFDALGTAIRTSMSDNPSDRTVADRLLGRVGITSSANAVIKYADLYGLHENDPSFLKDFILIPINTFLPRFLNPDKPVFQYGLWVTQNVYGKRVYSASYLTIQGCFYLMGGSIAVLLGSFILAIFIRGISGFVNLENKNVATLCVYLMLLKVLYEPNDPTTLIMSQLRNVFIYPLFCFFLIKKCFNTDRSIKG